jgi:phage shock protein B
VTIAVEGALVLIAAGVAAIIIALAVKLLKGLGGGGNRSDDIRTMQEIYEGLSRLERRIEALETILLDRLREGGKNG